MISISASSAKRHRRKFGQQDRHARRCRRTCRCCGSRDGRRRARPHATAARMRRSAARSASRNGASTRRCARSRLHADAAKPAKCAISISSRGACSRSDNAGTRLWPPAMKRASSPDRERVERLQHGGAPCVAKARAFKAVSADPPALQPGPKFVTIWSEVYITVVFRSQSKTTIWSLLRNRVSISTAKRTANAKKRSQINEEDTAAQYASR